MSTYVCVALIWPVDALPLKGLGPLHAPEATQDVAFVLLQLRIVPLLYFTGMVAGFAVSVTVGATATATVNCAVALEPAVFPGRPLLQVST